jgi:pre-mRNA-processing factor 17
VLCCALLWCAVLCLPVQIVTYLTKDRFKQNRKKTFKGHNTAGYACQVNFSPDAKYVMSGEAGPWAWAWTWTVDMGLGKYWGCLQWP